MEETFTLNTKNFEPEWLYHRNGQVVDPAFGDSPILGRFTSVSKNRPSKWRR